MLVLCLGLRVSRSAEAAGHAEFYAKTFRIEPKDVVEVSGFALPRGSAISRVLIGTWRDSSGALVSGVALLRCGATLCRVDSSIHLGPGQGAVLGVADLGGTPGPLGVDQERPRGGVGDYAKLPGVVRLLGQGVLVIRTEQADGARVLHLISLRATPSRTEARTLLSEPVFTPKRGLGGRRLDQTFELVRGKGKAKPLELSSSLQLGLADGSGCIRPAPWERRWQLHDGKFVGTPDQPPPGDGCH